MHRAGPAAAGPPSLAMTPNGSQHMQLALSAPQDEPSAAQLREEEEEAEAVALEGMLLLGQLQR